jgi:hypothetical protein
VADILQSFREEGRAGAKKFMLDEIRVKLRIVILADMNPHEDLQQAETVSCL